MDFEGKTPPIPPIIRRRWVLYSLLSATSLAHIAIYAVALLHPLTAFAAVSLMFVGSVAASLVICALAAMIVPDEDLVVRARQGQHSLWGRTPLLHSLWGLAAALWLIALRFFGSEAVSQSHFAVSIAFWSTWTVFLAGPTIVALARFFRRC